jgi:peptidoglycan hydrolase-like protein with peptidoglycan-binding domain
MAAAAGWGKLAGIPEGRVIEMAKAQKQEFRFEASMLLPSTAASDDVYRLQALLAKYGFLSNYTPGAYDQRTQDAVSQFQSFYRIYPENDGVADAATIDLLSQIRCGVPDVTAPEETTAQPLAPFVTVGAKWTNSALTYRFLNSSPDLPEQRQREIIRQAFQRWQNVSGLTFSELAQGNANLMIGFYAGSHGDGSSFDDQGGPDGNTLAHGFFPPPRGGQWAGALHFDEFEQWKDQPGGAGIRLYNVALHEIGHCLGLAHSQDNSAIMYAYYAENRNDLQPDDIAGIQSLYGAPAAAPTSLSPGDKVSGHLARTGAEAGYQVTVQDKMLVKLSGPSDQDFDVYVRFGQPVDRARQRYDEVSWGVTSEELVTIPNPQAGTYYILVHSHRGAGSFTLETKVT